MKDIARLTKFETLRRKEHRRINQVTEVDSYRTDWRLDSETKPNSICHSAKADIFRSRKYVAQIVERHEAEGATDWNSQLKIEDCKCIAANRYQHG